jgi:hypothetical protein
VKDVGQTLVVDRESGRSWALRGPEALVWDLLVVGYGYRRLIEMLCLILARPAGEVERTLRGLLGLWQEAGILDIAGGGDGG